MTRGKNWRGSAIPADFPAGVIARFEDGFIPEPNSGCWLWLKSTIGYGYGQFSWNKKQIAAHRFAFAIYKHALPAGVVVRHKCDVPHCVNPDHLKIGSQKDNIADSVMRRRHAGFMRGGDKNPSAKLTAEQVDEIRRLMLPQREIARRYGVAPATVWRIVRNISHREHHGQA